MTTGIPLHKTLENMFFKLPRGIYKSNVKGFSIWQFIDCLLFYVYIEVDYMCLWYMALGAFGDENR